MAHLAADNSSLLVSLRSTCNGRRVITARLVVRYLSLGPFAPSVAYKQSLVFLRDSTVKRAKHANAREKYLPRGDATRVANARETSQTQAHGLLGLAVLRC